VNVYVPIQLNKSELVNYFTNSVVLIMTQADSSFLGQNPIILVYHIPK